MGHILAKFHQNWSKIEDFLLMVFPGSAGNIPLDRLRLNVFIFFDTGIELEEIQTTASLFDDDVSTRECRSEEKSSNESNQNGKA